MLTDAETNFVYMSDLLPSRHPQLAATLERIFAEHEVGYAYLQGTKDIWCRDYMPIQLDTGRFLKFRYYPDYLRGYEHLITDLDAVRGAPFRQDQLETVDYVIDGGNLVHSKHRACMTDKIFQENPGVEHAALVAELEALLGVKLIIVPKEPYDQIGHADGILRFVDETVVLNDYRDLYPSYHARLVKVLESHGLKVVFFPYQPLAVTSAWQSASGNYVNYLQVGQLILIPHYHIESDRRAKKTLNETCPYAKVVDVDCRGLSQEGGVLNCVTWTVQKLE